MAIAKLMLVIAAALTAGSALAQEPAKLPPFDPGNYPPAVRKALGYANEECTRQGGGAATFAPDTVRKLDLTGTAATTTSSTSATLYAPIARRPIAAPAAVSWIFW